MYRGQDIGSKDELQEKCVEILKSGQIKRLYSILPHIGLVRSPRFVPPLIGLLRRGSKSQQLFSAMALGAIGDARGIEPLLRIFHDPETFRGAGTRSLQKAAILALGETALDAGVPALTEIYQLKTSGGGFSSTRKRLVIMALGTLAQHGVRGAAEQLTHLLSEREARLRAQAVTELGVAYWHCPTQLPESLLEHFGRLSQDRSSEVRNAVEGALLNLAQLGSKRAEQCLSRFYSEK